jgi:WD40 repeat protein
VYDLAAFSPDGKMLASGGRTRANGSWTHTIKLWDVVTGQGLHILEEHANRVDSLAFSPDGRTLVSGSWNKTIKLWKIATGENLATLTSIDDNDWLVVDSSGRFDASPGAMKWLRFVEGTQPLELDKYKDHYYEPGLLTKLLGFNKEPLRTISEGTK